ncbi:unnamed protein product [Nezara viridula]|uniref:Neuropeptide n=1 Tax=Nezara viridula TaxID=85310 RepID=A0A9P0HQW9_NEZVI|nr:unnamed protein product [Nezara viridula]
MLILIAFFHLCITDFVKSATLPPYIVFPDESLSDEDFEVPAEDFKRIAADFKGTAEDFKITAEDSYLITDMLSLKDGIGTAICQILRFSKRLLNIFNRAYNDLVGNRGNYNNIIAHIAKGPFIK